jgi:hypothetical protein
MQFQVCYFVVFSENPITFQATFWWPQMATQSCRSVMGGQPWFKV